MAEYFWLSDLRNPCKKRYILKQMFVLVKLILILYCLFATCEPISAQCSSVFQCFPALSNYCCRKLGSLEVINTFKAISCCYWTSLYIQSCLKEFEVNSLSVTKYEKQGKLRRQCLFANKANIYLVNFSKMVNCSNR